MVFKARHFHLTSTSPTFFAQAYDDKIVILDSLGSDSLVLTRLNADGTIDISFNAAASPTNFEFIYDFNDRGVELDQVYVKPSGKILILGRVESVETHALDVNWNIFVMQLNTDGTLDTTFGDIP